MVLGVCNLTIVPLRAEASHRSEMVSQLLFGDRFEILQQQADWVYIRLFAPAYDGWLQKGQFMEIVASESPDTEVFSNTQIVDLAGAYAVSSEQRIELLPGTSVPAGVFMSSSADAYAIEGALRNPTTADFEGELPKLVAYYSGAPYLWGGRSRYGIDCSGLSHAVFAHLGIALPRDAYQQAELGTTVDFLSEIKPGDLAFFDNEAGRITHVGIMLDSETILHASASVRIDKMDAEGIYHNQWKRYTHRFRIVKRYF